MSEIDPALLETLRRTLRAGPPLRLAVLFGSIARGQGHAGSDVDMGVVFADPALSLADELSLQVALERACGMSVDLVRLDEAPILLRWRVARDGVPLVADPPSSWTRFVATTASEHADIAPALNRAAALFQARVAAGAPR